MDPPSPQSSLLLENPTRNNIVPDNIENVTNTVEKQQEESTPAPKLVIQDPDHPEQLFVKVSWYILFRIVTLVVQTSVRLHTD